MDTRIRKIIKDKEIDIEKMSNANLRILKGCEKYEFLLMKERLPFKAELKCPECGESLQIETYPTRSGCTFVAYCSKCEYKDWDSWTIFWAESQFKNKGFKVPVPPEQWEWSKSLLKDIVEKANWFIDANKSSFKKIEKDT